MNANFTDEIWQAKLKQDPGAIVQPCACGTMPAVMTNVSGDTRRRCQDCYSRHFRSAMDFGGN